MLAVHMILRIKYQEKSNCERVKQKLSDAYT